MTKQLPVSISTGGFYVSKGCPKDGAGPIPQHASKKHAVRCCNQMGDSCTSEFKNKTCHGITKYYTAKQICSGLGKRLCFIDEMKECCESGCNYDDVTAWLAGSKGIAIFLCKKY